MRIIRITAALLGAGLLAVACGQSQERPKEDTPPPAVIKAVGQDLFEKKCVACHGISGRGDGEAAKVLNPKPKDLTSKEVQSKTDSELKKVLVEGKPGTAMQPLGLSDPEIADVIKYLRSLSILAK